MQAITAKSLTPTDLALLHKVIPKNPCERCNTVGRLPCIHCDDKRYYNDGTKQYRERGIYNIAVALRERRDLKFHVVNATRQEKDRISELNEALQEVDEALLRAEGR